jgi:hypothetical protein
MTSLEVLRAMLTHRLMMVEMRMSRALTFQTFFDLASVAFVIPVCGTFDLLFCIAVVVITLHCCFSS